MPGSQWSLWIIPMATFVLKSGDQAAEVTFPTKILFLRMSQLSLQGASGFPRISRKRICRHGPFSISSRRDSLPTHLIAFLVSQNLYDLDFNWILSSLFGAIVASLWNYNLNKIMTWKVN